MHRFLLATVVLTQACSTEEPLANVDPFTGDTVAPLAVTEAPPPGLTLAGPSCISPGGTYTFTVTGPMNPGEVVHYALGLGGVGSGPCPPALGSQCLGIVSPIKQIGTAGASGGSAALTVTVPAGAAIGAGIGMQTAVVRGPGGSASLLSQALPITVESSCSGTYQYFTWTAAGIANNGRANAAAYCAGLGGTLARPNSQADWDAIHAHLTEDSLGWWIDGHNNFTCGSALPGAPKTYEYGLMYSPSGTPGMYTGCNCYSGEQGLVVYKYNGGYQFDGCQGVDTCVGCLGAMDEELTYSYPLITGFICEL